MHPAVRRREFVGRSVRVPVQLEFRLVDAGQVRGRGERARLVVLERLLVLGVVGIGVVDPGHGPVGSHAAEDVAVGAGRLAVPHAAEHERMAAFGEPHVHRHGLADLRAAHEPRLDRLGLRDDRGAGDRREFAVAVVDRRLRGVAALHELALVDRHDVGAEGERGVAPHEVDAGAVDVLEAAVCQPAVDQVVVLDRHARLLLPLEIGVEEQPLVEHAVVEVDAVVAGVVEGEVHVAVLVVLRAPHAADVGVAHVDAGERLAPEGEVVVDVAGDVGLVERAGFRAVVDAGDVDAHAAALDGEVADAAGIHLADAGNVARELQRRAVGAGAEQARPVGTQEQRAGEEEGAGGNLDPRPLQALARLPLFGRRVEPVEGRPVALPCRRDQPVGFRGRHAVHHLRERIVRRPLARRIGAGLEQRLAEIRFPGEVQRPELPGRVGRRHRGRRRHLHARRLFGEILAGPLERDLVPRVERPPGVAALLDEAGQRRHVLRRICPSRHGRPSLRPLGRVLLGEFHGLLRVGPGGHVLQRCERELEDLRPIHAGGLVVEARPPDREPRVAVDQRRAVGVGEIGDHVEDVVGAALDRDRVRGDARLVAAAAARKDPPQAERGVAAVLQVVDARALGTGPLGGPVVERQAVAVLQPDAGAGVAVVGLDHQVDAGVLPASLEVEVALAVLLPPIGVRVLEVRVVVGERPVGGEEEEQAVVDAGRGLEAVGRPRADSRDEVGADDVAVDPAAVAEEHRQVAERAAPRLDREIDVVGGDALLPAAEPHAAPAVALDRHAVLHAAGVERLDAAEVDRAPLGHARREVLDDLHELGRRLAVLRVAGERLVTVAELPAGGLLEVQVHRAVGEPHGLSGDGKRHGQNREHDGGHDRGLHREALSLGKNQGTRTAEEKVLAGSAR